MTKMLSFSLALLLAGALTASAGERTSRKSPPPVLEVSRTIFRNPNGMHQFSFRGGVVNYWPSRGSQWIAADGPQTGATFAAAPDSATLPNGCLVYACARAEQIRLHPQSGESHSRVITYRREDGSGHAFVLYKSRGAYMAEDNYGRKTPMPAYRNRSSAEALYMAQTFQKRTASQNFAPIQASFVGKF
jgi:hypothetical protein